MASPKLNKPVWITGERGSFLRNYALVGIVLALVTSGIQAYVSINPQVEVTSKVASYPQMTMIGSMRDAYYFEVDFDKVDTIRGNVTANCSPITYIYDVPKLYVYTAEGYKAVTSGKGDWVAQAHAKFEETFVYNGKDRYGESYTRSFSFKSSPTGKYYFVLFFRTNAISGRLDIISTEPSPFAIYWPRISPWLTLFGVILTAIGIVKDC